ncbi:MAG TPA: Uma2 family endonuclease [Chloroflexota bacterium]|nr:Uma2 family endonuclease [Chloroflexota bacterium]
MVAQTREGPFWTVEQYIDMEEHSTVKHEYHSGQVYAMAGGAQAHSLIAVNLIGLLRDGVRGSGCRAFNSDIKVRQPREDYVHPDAAATCEPSDVRPDQVWIDYPVLVVEVLSRHTERHDRGDNFDGYKQVASLREYVLVESRRREVEVWRRDEPGSWRRTTYAPGENVVLSSVSPTVSMDVLYEDSGV